MLAVIGMEPLDAGILSSFRRLSVDGRVPSKSEKGHLSGWGAIQYTNSRPFYLQRETEPANTDTAFDRMMTSLTHSPAEVLLVHLRKASRGSVTLENTHPFIHDCYAFAHNGTLSEFHEPVGVPLKGETDSERLFKMILTGTSKGLGTLEAIRKAVHISKKYRHTSLTFILCDGQDLFAFREYTEKENADYYSLLCLKAEHHIVICQEPVIEGSWTEVQPNHLAIVGKSLAVHDVSVD